SLLSDYGLAANADCDSVVVDVRAVDEAVRKQGLVKAWEQAKGLCENPDGTVTQLDEIVLSGNASAYPLVQEVMREVFGDGRVFSCQPNRVLFDPDDAKLAVVKGAVLARWFRDFHALTINEVDGASIELKLNRKPILPYRLVYSSAGQPSGTLLFERGV